jgi:hypothetical protein
MSGGYFGYKQNRIEDIASEIDFLIDTNGDETLNEFGEKYGHGYPQEIIDKFRETAHTLRQAAEMAQRIDYLVSGDDGIDSFNFRWHSEVRKPFAGVPVCSECGDPLLVINVIRPDKRAVRLSACNKCKLSFCHS